MELALLVYGISLLHSVGIVTAISVLVCFATAAVFLIYRMADCGQEEYLNAEKNKKRAESAEWAMKWAKRWATAGAIGVLILVIVPTEKTAYTMVGAYAAQKIAENEKVQDTGQKVLTIINQKLDSYIQEGIESLEKKASKK